MRELARRLAQRDDDGVGRRVVGLRHAVGPARDHRLVHDGDRADRRRPAGGGLASLREGLAHEQLVVHARDHTTATSAQPGSGARMFGGPAARRRGSGPRAEPELAGPRRIGILTGGGDVPGLNSVIKSVVYRATELGYEVVGIRRGWEGLTHQRRGAGARSRVRPDPRPQQHADDRPDRRHDAPQLAHEPAQDARLGAAALARPGDASPTARPPTACTT